MPKPFDAAVGAVDRGSDRLFDFVRQRRGHLAQHAHTVHVGKTCLQRTQFLALLIGAFPIFNVGEGSVPFNDLSM
ncbi:MAG TPA: hypothetical protein VN833_28885, partial [Candidatus Acidoferrales bacterium]|nr:hypothetical protein [Candidatus Acidoferrales bacterium]